MELPRYRLRTLLVLVALFGLAFGAEDWRERRYRYFREMAAYHAKLEREGWARVYQRDSQGHMFHTERQTPEGEYHGRMRDYYQSRW